MTSEFKKYFELDKSFEFLKIRNDSNNTTKFNKTKGLTYILMGFCGIFTMRLIVTVVNNRLNLYDYSSLIFKKKKCILLTIIRQI